MHPNAQTATPRAIMKKIVILVPDNGPPKWILAEAQKKVIELYKQAKKTIRPKMERHHQSSSKHLNKKRHAFAQSHQKTPNPADDWQHQLSPKPTKTSVCETDLTTENSQQLPLETQLEDLYEFLHNTPDNYFPQKSTHAEIYSNSVIQHTTKQQKTT